ncbi:MAG: outer membrane lipoprotein-sorting protein [Bacteroidales bacterium]|nr:outer membrane lipoprotein-sorting protein [Bacteroidales bacterium]MCB9000124.1 outer membrane lipoprotein-sorting protein [Bacteroidales bacterium]MCB9014122.1 outer membrane lipoprotein-sorting protein [Bacteroidales bacterium]
MIKQGAFYLILLLFSASAKAQDAKEIVRKANDLIQGKSNYSEMTMTVHRPKWDRSIAFKSWSKGNDYSLIYITEPAKEKGQVFLKRKTEMWNWVPSVDRMIKIPPSMMMQSWMGSDVTNDDLVKQSSIVDDYEQTIEGKENMGGYECYKIQLIPTEDAVVVWGKIISWISVKDYYTMRNEYYDEDGELVNVETMSDIKNFGDRSLPSTFEIVPVNKKDQSTKLEIKTIRFNQNMDDSFFSLQNMKSIR